VILTKLKICQQWLELAGLILYRQVEVSNIDSFFMGSEAGTSAKLAPQSPIKKLVLRHTTHLHLQLPFQFLKRFPIIEPCEVTETSFRERNTCPLALTQAMKDNGSKLTTSLASFSGINAFLEFPVQNLYNRLVKPRQVLVRKDQRTP